MERGKVFSNTEAMVMPLFEARCPDLVIPNGLSDSNILKAREVFEDAEAIMLYGLNVTDGVITFTIQITNNIDAAAPTFFTLQTPPGAPADIAPPLQGKAFTLTRGEAAAMFAADAFKIHSSAPVTAIRTWNVSKQFRT